MQDFATAKVSPWSFAWLVREGDWNHLERLIHYNCILLSGVNNVIIPVSQDIEFSPELGLSLRLFDPDFVVLPPKVNDIPKNLSTLAITPFAIVRWNQLHQIMTDDPRSGSSTWAVSVQPYQQSKFVGHERDLVAVSDSRYPDMSRLALLACGDVLPAKPDWDEFDGQVYMHADGYREFRLAKVAREGFENEVSARLGDDDVILPAPSRLELGAIIKDENKFPLEGAAKILEACCALQNPRITGCFSFTGRSANYQDRVSAFRRFSHVVQIPAMTVMVSDHFEFAEAILFWNLRANRVIASWLSFDQLTTEKDAICTWLDSDIGGSLIGFGGGDVAFAANKQDQSRLNDLFAYVSQERRHRYPQWIKTSYDQLLFYDRERPSVDVAHLMVNRESCRASFLPNYPPDILGPVGLTLEWPPTKQPQNQLVAKLISDEKIHTLPGYISSSSERPPALDAFRVRITSTRDVRVTISDHSPVTIAIPSALDVFRTLFASTGFKKISDGSCAQYQRSFIKRAGDLESASELLAASSYRSLFQLLTNPSLNKTLAGWVLKDPKRRALRQHELFEVFCDSVSYNLKNGEKDIETLPRQIEHLLTLDLLDRGFQLLCSLCSAKTWYAAEEVGESFKCHRCYEPQKLIANPVWLYKLPEVVFQLMSANADVALLALSALQKKSIEHFDYILDIDIFQASDTKGQNIDFSCISDGRAYIGESKSVDYIEEKQFNFYRHLARHVPIDGVVFATTSDQWNSSTLILIEELKKEFYGDVRSLTKADLLGP